MENEYLKSMSEKERRAYEIAKEHMGCLLNLKKTNGYLKWIEKKKSDEKST